MLKTIVQQDHLCLELNDSHPRLRHTIRTLKMGNIRQILLQHPPLIVESASMAITTAQNRNPNLVSTKPAGKPLDHRRFSRSAERQVAHRNNRNCRRMTAQPATVVTPVARRDHRSIRERSRARSSARQLRQDAARFSSNQSQILFTVQSNQSSASIARMIAFAISSVPTAVGSLRSCFRSYVTSLPSSITVATALSSFRAALASPR